MKLKICFKDHYPCRAETCGEYDVCKVRLAKEKQTNEEWRRNCSAEQLTEVFGSMLFEAWKDGLAEEMHDKRFYENLIEFWLKQPHRDKEQLWN